MYQSVLLKSIQVKVQNKIQPKSIDKNFQIHSKIVKFVKSHQCIIIDKTTTNKATAVPSLNKLSPSNIVVSLLGAHNFLKIDKTATGSVAEISAQKSKQTR